MLVAALSLPCAGYLAARPHGPARPRASPPVAYFSFDKAPEMVSLKDQLMEASVQHQLQHFRCLAERGGAPRLAQGDMGDLRQVAH